MESEHLRQQITTMRQSFFDEDILDEQFSQLEQLKDGSNSNFVEDVLTMYFRDSTTLLQDVQQEMEEIVPIDLIKVDKMLHKLKGSSASVGANKVRHEIIKTRKLLGEGDLEGGKIAFKEIQKEYGNLKPKLETYFQQLRHVGRLEAASRLK